MNFYLAAIIMGLCLSLMTLGIFISMKIFKIPDITTDGSYTLGAAFTAITVSHNMPLPAVIPIVLLLGALSGAVTGLIHTKLKLEPLLAGILVMTALYSVNLTAMGRSNIPIITQKNIFNYWTNAGTGLTLVIVSLIAVIAVLLLKRLLQTDFGIAMRATGDNPYMAAALGINVKRMKVTGLAIANALTAFSGFLICQYQQFADINMGMGIVIAGLGSVLIADTFIQLFKIKSFLLQLLLMLLGSIAFQLILALALSLGVHPNLLKLITAAFVLCIVALPSLSKYKPASV